MAIFQSTLPGWGATIPSDRPSTRRTDFNPRSPGGERPLHAVEGAVRVHISIHAPRVGSDLQGYNTSIAMTKISIHAPRVGSDRKSHCRY